MDAALQTQYQERLDELALCLDYLWMLVAGFLVMLMQAGFAMLEAGCVRKKNAGSVLFKNVSDACVGAICWWLFGYGLAYGASDEPNSFLGTKNFASTGMLEIDNEGNLMGNFHLKDWFFQWAFCATAATIVSGGVAERVQLSGYVIYSALMTAWIYPVIVWWTWSGNGWLTEFGYSDFAGSGIVHLTGGIGALVGAIVVGPRSGRWEHPEQFSAHNVPLAVLGTFILWFGWYGFNPGSTLAFSDKATATTAALAAVNTTLSAAAGGLIVLFAQLVLTKKYDLLGMCNGILAGLVGVCAGVGDVAPGSACIIGLASGLAYLAGVAMEAKCKIDDPLSAFPVHGMAGIVGCLLRPLLDFRGANVEMFGANIVGVLAISAWSGCLTALVFKALDMANLLRITEEMQEKGVDTSELGINAYPLSPTKNGKLPEHVIAISVP